MILLVEDNPADVELIREGILQTQARIACRVVEDGVEAMGFLRRQGKYENAEVPDLVLLDLNLPRKNGREVLAEMRADENSRTIPVIVFTTSSAREDVIKCYRLGANCYITKPTGLDRFVGAVKAIEGFWLKVATLPTE